MWPIAAAGGAANGDCAPCQPAGAVTASSGLTVSAAGITVASGGGGTSIQAMSVAGAAIFGSTAAITGTLTASGAASVAGLLTSTGGIAATGETHLRHDHEVYLLVRRLACHVRQICSGGREWPQHVSRAAAGSNTFGSGSGSTTPFTVYSAATFGTSGTTNTLTVYSPTTQAGSLTVTGAVLFSGSLTAIGVQRCSTCRPLQIAS